MFFYFRKTVQLQWARFKKGPFLPEADISGKKEEKHALRSCFCIAYGIRYRHVSTLADYRKKHFLGLKCQ